MGFLSNIVGEIGSIFSGGADDAARDAANVQSRSADKAIDLQRESRDLARGDLAPFREAGVAQLNPLSSLISDPKAQLDYVQNNPFFKALADDAQGRLFSNRAAKGKVGSGGTAEALQNSILLLGQNLLNNNINQRFNLANMGQSAAAGQANTALTSGQSISDLITGQGNAQAAGIVGAANARSGGINSLIQGGAALALAGVNPFAISPTASTTFTPAINVSDRRAKTDIVRIGTSYDNLPIYRFRYKGDSEIRLGVMADEVEKVKPEAVFTLPNGLQAVDYSQIGVAA